jgi:Antitoxin-like ribbon-helix-helix
MSKRSSLSDALRHASGKTEEQKPPAVSAQAVQPGNIQGRTGKKNISGWFDPAVSRQIKQMALEKDDSSIQELLREAINDLFEKYGKSRIA